MKASESQLRTGYLARRRTRRRTTGTKIIRITNERITSDHLAQLQSAKQKGQKTF
jgi:hypothetical protein